MGRLWMMGEGGTTDVARVGSMRIESSMARI